MGRELTRHPWPKPQQKKSPRGASTDGVSSPSQYMRSTRSRSTNRSASLVLSVTVIQMCSITPGPSISPNRAVSPGLISPMQGDPFREGPRWLAAVPPFPFSPRGFSALMARLSPPVR